MSHFGYKFLGKTPELTAQRRVTLDWYANLAQMSQLAFHLIIPFCNLISSVVAGKRIGNSRQKVNQSMLARAARSSKFRLDKEVVKGYGTHGQWIFGMGWAAWLGFLCIAETAPDYLHLTKRFGLIAASQLPIHYLLTMTHEYLPRQFLLQSSHRLNMSLHRVSGKIIISFFAIHISLYSLFFIEIGMFWESIQRSSIVVAIISAGVLFLLGITATRFFRRRYYRWFYKIHVIGSAIILPLLFFHVNHIRIYLFESAAVLLMNAIFRILSFGRL